MVFIGLLSKNSTDEEQGGKDSKISTNPDDVGISTRIKSFLFKMGQGSILIGFWPTI